MKPHVLLMCCVQSSNRWAKHADGIKLKEDQLDLLWVTIKTLQWIEPWGLVLPSRRDLFDDLLESMSWGLGEGKTRGSVNTARQCDQGTQS